MQYIAYIQKENGEQTQYPYPVTANNTDSARLWLRRANLNPTLIFLKP